MREEEQTLRAAGAVSIANQLSRFFGLARDMAVAGFFGAGPLTDAFFVAWRIPNLFRRSLAEGSLTVSFVPLFTERLVHHSRADARGFVDQTFSLLAIFLLGFSALGVVLAEPLVYLIASGFASSPEKFDLAVRLTRIMFPYIFFASTVALSMGILNSLGHFFTPSVSTVFLNGSMIAGVLVGAKIFPDEPAKAILVLAAGALFGGLLQLLLQVPVLRSRGFLPRPTLRRSHPALRRVFLLMAPMLLGQATYQLNILVDTILASRLPDGSVSYLYYADRLIEFPLGVFIYALGVAFLPSLSKLVTQGRTEEVRAAISFAVRMVLFISLPALAGLIVLREPIIRVLFERNEFSPAATEATAGALLYYAVGLWAIAVARVLLPVYYARQDTRTPVAVGFAAFLVNLGLNLLFAFQLGMQHRGLALATAVAAMFQAFTLGVLLHRRVAGGIPAGEIIRSALRSIAAASVMVIATVVLLRITYARFETPPELHVEVFLLAAFILVGAAVYFVAAGMLRSNELRSLWSSIRQSKKSP